SRETIEFPIVNTFMLKHGMHISNHLVWRQVVVSLDGTIPGIIGVSIIAPSREPVSRVPVIWHTKDEHDPVMMTAPPTLVMPLWRVVPENGISGALPVLATLDVPALLE